MEPNLELHPALEAEIKALNERAEIKAQEKSIEKSEAMSSTIRERFEELGEKAASAEHSKILPEYSGGAPDELKLFVEQVVDKLWHDGNLTKAVNEARKGGPLTLDILHDVLLKMSDALKARGIL